MPAAPPTLRDRIVERFSAAELRVFCDDHFPDVGREFPDGMALTNRAQLLIARCARSGRAEALLDALAAARPGILGDDRAALLAELTAIAALPEDEYQKIINATANQQISTVSGGTVIGVQINISAPVYSPERQSRYPEMHLITEFAGQAVSAPLRVGQPTPLFVWVGERIEPDQGRTSRPFAFDLSQQAQPVAFEVRVDADPQCWTIESVQPRLVVTPQGATETAAVFRVTARRPGADKLYLSVVQAASGAAVQHVWLPVTAAERDEAIPAAPAPTAVRLPLTADDLRPRLVQLTFARGRDAESFSVVVDADLPGGRVHQFYSVPLSAAAVQNATLRLRQELERIVLFAEERGGSRHYPFADLYRLTVDDATARRAAAPLADAGQQVWHLLFNAPRAPEGLKRIGAALRDLPHGSALQVVIESQQFIVPWALLYDRPGEITPATLDWAGFWGYRYVLDVLPPGDYPDPTIAARPPTARLLFNDDAELRRFADAQERAAREGLGQVETARGAEQAREALRAAAGGESTLLYVFCHGQHASGLAQPGALASESALTFGRGDRVRLADMRRIVSGPLPGRPLVFLNACEGATQDAFFYDGFMPFFIEECGARGFIGTEVKAPQLLAHDVALRFMQLFAAGVPVGEALWRLRRAYLDEHHNPLALNYTLYGLREVRLVQRPASLPFTFQFPTPLPPPSPRHQLRAPVADFVGRAEEIAQVVAALQPAAQGGAMAISGLRGMGGIGKTELAYAAAQRLAPSFSDAQIVLALRGASATPLSPEQALARVVQVFYPEAKLPDDLEQLKGLYASCLHGQRVLILADDARDASQVRPLLPPPGCALLITSRQHFTLPGMRARNLDTLPPADAEALLLAIHQPIGEHAAELSELCGYLPLALRVSAGLLANSSRTVARFVEQLRAERLKHLEDPDDPQVSVAASLQLSYDALDQSQQTALTQLAVLPASFDRGAALAVLDAGNDAEALLDALVRRSLLEWDAASERFDLHDLVRVFAAARLADEDAAWLRHARHYVAVASEAEDNHYLKGDVLGGLALFDRERVQIDAGWQWVMAHAGAAEVDRLLSAYADATAYIGNLRDNKRRERIPQLEAALGAARRLGNRSAEGAYLGNLGLAHAALGDARRAIEFYEQALIVAREIGNRMSEGKSLGNLGSAYNALGDAQRAIAHHEQWLSISREIGDRRSEGNALNNLGIAYSNLGDTRRAIEFYEQALIVAREIGDRIGEGNMLGNLGLAHADLGDARRAMEYHEQDLAIAREIGDRRGEGTAWNNIGLAHMALDDVRRAIEFYEQALIAAREIGNRRVEGTVLGNLGIACRRQGDTRRAIGFYEQQLVIARELGDRRGEGAALGNLALTQADLGDARRAIELYEKQLAITCEIGDRRGEAFTSWNLGLRYEAQGDLARAIALMQVCVDFEREIGHSDAEPDAARVESLRQRLAAGDGVSGNEA